MSTNEVSEIDFSDPHVSASLARAYAVLIERSKHRAKARERAPHEDESMIETAKPAATQPAPAYQQLRLF